MPATPNDDEALPQLIGSFHKTLPHDEYGLVNPEAYDQFKRTCLQIEATRNGDLETVPRGVVPPGGPFEPGADTQAAAFTSPLAGAATERLGPEPTALEMRPAPGILSASAAAEMVELYWMALLRDHPLVDLSSEVQDPSFAAATAELQSAFQTALDNDSSDGALHLGEDLPANGTTLVLTPQTLFRSGLPDEQYGPLVSQFFLRDVTFGTQTIDQSQRPYAAGRDHLTRYDDWMRAQNTGKDRYGRDYANCNHYADDPAYYGPQRRKIATMRDLARFVNRDALHQAYFNAALFLDAIGAPGDQGNPYANGTYRRQSGFATLGSPDLLTLVSEVASRALKVVWRQKWLVHRRARPEVYGGLVEMQRAGPPGRSSPRPFGIPALVAESAALGRVVAKHGTGFLPMAFSAGSPPHPAYGAGHATVAGACVTVLKAWFDETRPLETVLAAARAAGKGKEPPGIASLDLLAPGRPDLSDFDHFHPPARYEGADAMQMTIGGELNKLASNVAMGRSMGGVHWRSDNTRSLRLGEQIAIAILCKRVSEYAENAVSFTFTSFDRRTVRIDAGGVSVT